MTAPKQACVFILPLLLFAADDQSWQNKPIAEWSADEAKQVLKDSPWAKSLTPMMTKPGDSGQRKRRGGMGQIGGVGIGMPGMPGMGGMGRRGGMGAPGTNDTPTGGTSAGLSEPPTLTARWESALPVQAAELKTRNVNAPGMDDQHYAIEVAGIPSRMVPADTANLADQLKDQAVIKRDEKKDWKPSSVKVIPGDDFTVVVYFFSRSDEISRKEKLEFDAQILRLKLSQSFSAEEMIYRGKLEL